MSYFRRFLFLNVLLAAAGAVSSDLVPVYDDDSFRIGLTLPFVVQAVKDNSSWRIQKVTAEPIAGAPNCVAMNDPLISANFLMKCEETGSVRLRVLIAKGGDQASEILYGPMEIRELKAGYREPVAPKKDEMDPEAKAGRDVLFTKTQSAAVGGRTCVGCHSTPGKYAKIMSAGVVTLKTISSNPSMPGVSNLSDAEAQSVIKYLQLISDPGEWP